MRFIYGKIPTKATKDFLIEDASALASDYEKIFGYGPLVSFLMVAITTVLWMMSGIDPLWPLFSLPSNPTSALPALLVIVCTTVMHEAIHLISYPGFWKDDKAGIGFMPKILVPYAWYSGVLSKKRALLSLLNPFICLTFLPIAIQLLFHPFAQDSYIPWMSVFNAMSAGGDLLLSMLVFIFVPRGALMQGTAYGMKLKTNAPQIDAEPSRTSEQ